MKNSSFIVTSVVRRAGNSQASGFIRVVDRQSGQVLSTTPIPESAYRHLDDNPRGGLRGGRGVSAWGDRIVVANTERLLVFDHDMQLKAELTHPLMGGVHDIFAEEDGIWVTCAASDLLVKLNWDGDLVHAWEWRADASLRESLGFEKLPPVDRSVDYRNPVAAREAGGNVIHLNAVSRSPRGLLLSFGRILSPTTYHRRRASGRLMGWARKIGIHKMLRRARAAGTAHAPAPLAGTEISNSTAAIVLLRDDGTTEILARSEQTSRPNHNVLDVNGLLVYNDTNAHELVGLSHQGGARRAVTIPGNPPFARGLAHLEDLEFLVGSQAPLAVYHVDLATGRVLTTFALGGEANEAVYDICLLGAP